MPSIPLFGSQADADIMRRYESYWRRVLGKWNTRVEGIGHTINNPVFDAAPPTRQSPRAAP